VLSLQHCFLFSLHFF